MHNTHQSVVPAARRQLQKPTALPPRPRLASQHLWLRLSRDRTWRSLALIPAGPDLPVQRMATDLAHAACYEAPGRVLVVNAVLPTAQTTTGGGGESGEWPVLRHFAGFDAIDVRQLPRDRALELLRGAAQWLEGLRKLGVHDRQIFAVDPVVREISAMPLCKSVDRALLVVGLGRTRLAEARKTIELLGRDRFLGVVSCG